MNSLQANSASVPSTPPPVAVYLSAWAVTLSALIAVYLAQLSKFSLVPFLMVITLGTAFSMGVSRLRLSELTRAIFGVLDGTLAFLAITAQSFLNDLFGLQTDPSVEIYLTLSLLWYLVLRSWLMVSLPAVAFQNVPALALFGLIATYIMANEVLWLFACFVLAMLFAMAIGHFVEWRAQIQGLFRRAEPLSTQLHHPPTAHLLRMAVGFGVAGILFGVVMTPLLSLTFGQLISGLVVGLPIRHGMTNPSNQNVPSLMVGSGPTVLSQMLVMRVNVEGADSYPYLRMDTYDFYTGRGWNRRFFSYMRPEWVAPNRFTVEHLYRFLPSGNRVKAQVKLLTGWHRTLYAPGFPVEAEAQVSQMVFARPSAVLMIQPPLRAGSEYTVVAYAPPNSPRLLRRAQSQLPGMLGAYPPPLPDRSERLTALVNRLTAAAPTDYDKVMALKRYIEQNALYNLNIEPYPTDVDVVEYFLFEAKQGYCIEFATALAVMCQYAGLPARVVSGFLLKERDPETGEYLVREAHRHLWTEVYFEGVGWVSFDATENARVVDGQTDTLTGSADTQGGRTRFSPERLLIDGLIGVGILYLLYALVGARLTALVRRESASSAEAYFQRRRVQLYRQLLFWLRLAGMPAPQTGQTPSHYLRTILPELEVSAPRSAQEVALCLEPLARLLYARPEDAESELATIHTRIRALRRHLWQEIGGRRLITHALRLGWQRAYGDPVPTVRPAQG